MGMMITYIWLNMSYAVISVKTFRTWAIISKLHHMGNTYQPSMICHGHVEFGKHFVLAKQTVNEWRMMI